MLTEADAERLVLSRRTLMVYEASGLPGGRREDVLRMLASEIMLLREIATRGTGNSSSIPDLIRRWEALRDRVRGH